MKEQLYASFEMILESEEKMKKVLSFETIEELYKYFLETLPGLTKDDFEDFICEALEYGMGEQEKVSELKENDLESISGGKWNIFKRMGAGFFALASMVSAPNIAGALDKKGENIVSVSQNVGGRSLYKKRTKSIYKKIKKKVLHGFEKVKSWVKKHPKLAIGGTIATIAVVVAGGVIVHRIRKNKEKALADSSYTPETPKIDASVDTSVYMNDYEQLKEEFEQLQNLSWNKTYETYDQKYGCLKQKVEDFMVYIKKSVMDSKQSESLLKPCHELLKRMEEEKIPMPVPRDSKTGATGGVYTPDPASSGGDKGSTEASSPTSLLDDIRAAGGVGFLRRKKAGSTTVGVSTSGETSSGGSTETKEADEEEPPPLPPRKSASGGAGDTGAGLVAAVSSVVKGRRESIEDDDDGGDEEAKVKKNLVKRRNMYVRLFGKFSNLKKDDPSSYLNELNKLKKDVEKLKETVELDIEYDYGSLKGDVLKGFKSVQKWIKDFLQSIITAEKDAKERLAKKPEKPKRSLLAPSIDLKTGKPRALPPTPKPSEGRLEQEKEKLKKCVSEWLSKWNSIAGNNKRRNGKLLCPLIEYFIKHGTNVDWENSNIGGEDEFRKAMKNALLEPNVFVDKKRERKNMFEELRNSFKALGLHTQYHTDLSYLNEI